MSPPCAGNAGPGAAPPLAGPALPTAEPCSVPPLRLPHTDWLYHRLTVSGPSGEVERFRHAAAGTGIIPWHLDLDGLEEDWFLRLMSPPRELASPAARAERRRCARARPSAARGGRRPPRSGDRVGQPQSDRGGLAGACPFDLHALVPVPDDILRLGPDDPGSLAWLWEHWGTTEPLRHVENATAQRVPGGGNADQGSAGESRRHGRHHETAGGRKIVFTFWSADWTPWRALSHVAAAWSALSFDVRPHYERA